MITKKTRALLCAMLGVMAVSPTTVNAQDDFGLVEQTLPNPENTPLPVFPVPSERQLKWNETEFYAFFHYGMNTYTGEEWGLGSESENQFAPPLCPTLAVAHSRQVGRHARRHRRHQAPRWLLPVAHIDHEAQRHLVIERQRQGDQCATRLRRSRQEARHEP